MRNRRGLTMAEVMVSITVLFVVSSFIMGMFVMGARQTAQATQNHDLASLTRTKLSEVQSLKYGDLDGIPTTGNFPAPNDGFSFRIDFSVVDGQDLADARIVEVTVSHPDYGTRSARTVRADASIDPGKEAWEKFGCGACHTLPAGGYPDLAGRRTLGPIPVAGPPARPVGPGGLEEYVADSIRDPMLFEAYTAGPPDNAGFMQDFIIEGEPGYDPNSTDPVTAANSMSTQEVEALATWITSLQ